MEFITTHTINNNSFYFSTSSRFNTSFFEIDEFQTILASLLNSGYTIINASSFEITAIHNNTPYIIYPTYTINAETGEIVDE